MDTATGTTVAERVAAGLAWIKANAERLNLDPARIDPDRINVSEEETCVLASAGARPFHSIMRDAGHPEYSLTGDWITEHGFGWDWHDNPVERDNRDKALCNEWRRVILAQREPSNA